MNLFTTPIRRKEFRKGVFAYQYPNGTINIEGQKYLMCSMTQAIQMHRKNYPLKQIV
jgi:hypothetical protein